MSTKVKPNLSDPWHMLAFGFGSGCAPVAPGTFGTLVGVLIYLPLAALPLANYIAITIVVSVFGIWLCQRVSDDLGVHDHGGIVWDEIAGFMVTMIALPVTWQWVLAGFVLFRLFDIWKPWPIGWVDKKVSGGLGIMLDDIIAGIFASVILQITYRFVI